MKYRIFIEQDENEIFVAECPSLPGCISQGKSRKEVLENIQDAIKGYLESLRKHDEPISFVIPMKMGIQKNHKMEFIS